MTLAEREHVEAFRPGSQRVRVLRRKMDEAISGTDLERLGLLTVPLQRDPRAAEDVEDLLLRVFEMERRRPRARVDLDPSDTDRDRPLTRQGAPRTGDVASLFPRGLD